MPQTIKPKLIRAYVREGITRIPVDLQKFEIQKVGDELGLEVRWYTGVALKAKNMLEERELWARQLRRDEVGLIHSLPVLRLSRKQLGGVDPKADFAGFMSSINALYLMETSTRITSTERLNWKQAVTQVAENPPPGSKSMSKEKASKLAKDGWKTRNKGVRFTWKSEAREKELRHLIRHWLASDTAATALSTLPQFIDDMGGGVYEELRGISASGLRIICNTPRK